MADTFRAIVANQEDNKVTSTLQELSREQLPAGEVLVRVAYSAINYKDGLALTGRNKVIRSYPMVPGIDFSGTVEESTSPEWKPGDQVILTGWGVGEKHFGGFSQYARVPAGWLVPAPEGLTLHEAAAVGTAGFTAVLCVEALEQHGLQPDEREVLVTGASGGVGSMAVALLGSLGYRVVAETGKTEAHDFLRELGAKDIVGRDALAVTPGRPLGSARWGGAVDTVGGEMLAGTLSTLAYGASVAACGNAGGLELHTTILPFILRSVNLLGIDSLPVPVERRKVAWQRIATILPKSAIEKITERVVPLAEVPERAHDILGGKVRGRLVVDVNQ